MIKWVLLYAKIKNGRGDMEPIMSAKRPTTRFNEFWSFFWNEARDRGYNQKEFMRICGLPKTRFNAFMRAGEGGGMNLTAHYVNKFLEGLRMTEDYVEKKSGKKFTEEQRAALRRAAWTDHNPDIIDALSSSRALTKKLRELIAENEKTKYLERHEKP